MLTVQKLPRQAWVHPCDPMPNRMQLFAIMTTVTRLHVLVVLLLVLAGGLIRSAHAQELEEIGHEALQQLIAERDANVTVVNFWATWCGPCREEFPDFVQLDRDYEEQGVDVLFVSMDFPDEQEAILDFLNQQGWEQPSYLRIGKDNAFIKAMHEDWTGVLPATFVYTQGGTLVHFSQGTPLHYDELVEYISPHL